MAKFKLDDTDHKILDMLIENTRTPFTDIAKKLNISALQNKFLGALFIKIHFVYIFPNFLW